MFAAYILNVHTQFTVRLKTSVENNVIAVTIMVNRGHYFPMRYDECLLGVVGVVGLRVKVNIGSNPTHPLPY